ncbi:MAG: NAD(P)H-hydrate dehydratase [Ruminococcaceae bacterium]|nr:NAD(P)H-hydrate dehydratase [Oscillospiraceae bacterium]
MDVLTKDLIKISEENAVHNGAFSFLELMKTAGDTAYKIICENIETKNKKIAVVCGSGNNGGDGFVVAQNFATSGNEVTVVLALGNPKTESAKYYFDKLKNVNVTDKLSGEYDVIIDAVFGIGLERELSKDLLSLVENINSQNAVRVAIDIPSGIESDSGKILGGCVNADLTVTFIALKPCFLLPDATNFTGKVVVADIGVEPVGFKYKTIEAPKPFVRPKNSHKGTFGTAVMFCGSYGMAGASILSARACLKSGVGIAKCVIPKSIYEILTVAVPEAVCSIAKQTQNGGFKGNINLQKPLEKATAVLVGCGIGNTRNTKKLVKRILQKVKCPIVVDADGINALVSNINVLKKTNASVVLTPHPAEMSRLLGISVKDVEQNRVDIATNFAKEYNCFVVLKGSNTIVATPDSQVFFNTCGNSGLATGGSGDVLAGMILSYLAQGLDTLNAVNTAVFLHSDVADKVAYEIGEQALLPSDIIEAL